MAHAGHALIGDQTYGGRRKMPKGHPGLEAVHGFPRQALHAAELGFVHPVTKADMHFSAEMPPDMQALRAALAD
jgi:23S rRNA pseudouridine1911/1915/1917 synthase